MIDQSVVEAIVKEQLNPEKEFVVGISVSVGNRILVLIDSDEGVTIDRCVHISRSIEQSLDRDQEDFELEVASAGLSEPLKLPRQYKKNVGRNLDVLMSDGEKKSGKLLQATETTFTLDIEEMVLLEGKKRKQKVVKQLSISYNEIKSAFVVISFR